MTLDEAIQMAKSGNTEAMYALGSFYFDQKQPSDAMEWLYQAVQQGHLPSAKLGSRISELLAVTCEKMQDWSGAGEYWSQYRECQPVLMRDPAATGEDCIRLMQEMNRALFRQGLACCHLERFDLAIGYLQEAAKDSQYVPGNEDAKKLLRQLGG